MARNILIIGNGFDLYHKLPTRYNDFMFFASEWDTFYLEYEKNIGAVRENKQISVPLTDRGELTQESLAVFGHNPYLMKKDHIEFLRKNLKTNVWIKYFQELQRTGMKWVDFEAEIQSALYDAEEYSMESIRQNVGKTGKEDLSDRLKRIPDIFGSAARNGYLNFGDTKILASYADISELQKNKLKLIEFMVDELDSLITCLQYYLDDFVSNIKCSSYSEQIKKIGEVDVLNFNYTTTYRSIYRGENLHHHHAVHGGIANGDIVLGISDDAFPNTYDYIRFQKYFQRIQKRTGSFYREWINYEHGDDGTSSQKEVFIMGHSLGLADFGVLRDFFEGDWISKVTIFYHSQSSYEDLVVNLVKALGKDPTIEMIGTEKIVFQELKVPVLMMD